MTDSDPVLGKKDSTQAALRSSIMSAVRSLEEQLDEPPDIAELAREAGLSKFHFQRAFQAVVGETVTRHSIRLRIERGASLLKFSTWQVGEIALVCGFKTQASFNRDFKKNYGMTPLQFRRAESTVPFLRGYMRSRPGEELSDPNQPVPTVHLETWPDLSAVCLRVYGGVQDVHQPWKELLAWARAALPDFEQARFLGLWFDEWSGASDNRYRYECAIVPATPLTEPPPLPYFQRRISGGLVAVAQAQGRQDALDRAWKAFATGWLPFSGYQPSRDTFAIDEYPVELAKKSLATKASMLLKGISIRMCLQVQREPLDM